MQVYQVFTLTPFIVAGLLLGSVPASADCIVLLHGLARTAGSMGVLETALEEAGYRVQNLSYPSRDKPIEALAGATLPEAIERCAVDGGSGERIHFVTHSLGGILVRFYLAEHDLPALGRVVMLGPPNQGSEVVDRFRNVPGFAWLNGPAGQQLGTDAAGVPASLPPVDFELGVIAGTRSINPILSQSLPGTDDGKVTVRSTRVDGMSDFITVPHTHTFMMRAEGVVAQVLHFLREGRFAHPQ